MKEIYSILSKYQQVNASGQQMALATVVHVENSSYRRSGARMLIAADGSWTGGISGGCLEGDTLKKAKLAMLTGEPAIVRYDTRDGDPNQIGVGLGCNGLIDVLITPLSADDRNGPLAILKRCVETRQTNVVITILRAPGSEAYVGQCVYATDESDYFPELKDLDIKERISYAVRQVKFTKKSKTVHLDSDSGSWHLFIEYLAPAVALYICGNNYDTKPLAHLAKYIGWAVHLVANPLKVDKETYALADTVQHPDKPLPDMDYHSAVILMAHDLNRDSENLRKAMASTVGYIGILGPKKRSDKLLAASDTSLTQSDSRIFAPVGLDTGATSPEEIAISIIAEIRTFYSGREGGFLRERPLPIND